jgi:hypothetical protein
MNNKTIEKNKQRIRDDTDQKNKTELILTLMSLYEVKQALLMENQNYKQQINNLIAYCVLNGYDYSELANRAYL